MSDDSTTEPATRSMLPVQLLFRNGHVATVNVSDRTAFIAQVAAQLAAFKAGSVNYWYCVTGPMVINIGELVLVVPVGAK